MSSPIKDPEIPYVGRIEGGFTDGHLVRIQGFTAPVANKFNINLQCDGSDNADIAVHLSVRLQEGYVARNSFQDGEWGDEQGDGDLTIGMGQKFEILVLSASNDYKIAINGQHFGEFPHRIAPSKITHLKIDGDVAVSLISYEGGDMAKSSSSQQNTSYGQQQPNYVGYGPPQQGGYGPPQQGGYGPGPQGYGPPPPGYQPYGQQGGYGAPPPPGYQQEHESGGLGDFLGTASEVIAGAIKSGMADKLLGQLTGGNQQHHDGQQHPQQQPHQYQQQQPQQPFQMPQFGGGGSVGGLGSVGSLLTGFADQLLHPKRPTGPPPAGVNLPSAPSAPSAPPIGDDDKPPSIYPRINDNINPGGPGFPSIPMPGSSPSIYPTSPGITPTPGFRPPGPGGFPTAQNIGPYPRSPNPNGAPNTNYYPRSPSYPYSPAPTGYPSQPSYPSQPGYPGYYSGQRQPTSQKYGNYQGGAGNNAPVPAGYYVYKPQDNYHTNNKDSSTMDKVKKYGLPIIGAGVATYALSKLTDGFGMGGHSSDSD